jgi:hypothetical protein
MPVSAASLSRRLLRLHGVNPLATLDRNLTEAAAQAWLAELDGPAVNRRVDCFEVAPVGREG